MVARIWHAYTSFENAPVFETMLKSEIFPGIRKKGIKGFKDIQLLIRNLDKEVEFITIMWFDSMESIKGFAGDVHDKAVIYPAAKSLLLRFDERSQHYDVSY